MNNLQKRLINRFIERIFLITKDQSLKLFLLNLCSRILVNKENRIEYDFQKKIFWFKNKDQYLPPSKNANFYFRVDRFEKSIYEYICKKYVPKKGDVIVDLGAGVGEEIYFFSKRIQSYGKLYSIEASPENFLSLELLTQKYDFNNCLNFNLAISNYNGNIMIKEDDFYLLKRVDKNIEGIEIPCFTLDSFVQTNCILRIDFLKVNIEGSEYELIEGMQKSIKIIKNAAISCHDFLNLEGKKNIKKRLIDFFQENGFEVTINESGDIVKDSWIYAEKKNHL